MTDPIRRAQPATPPPVADGAHDSGQRPKAASAEPLGPGAASLVQRYTATRAAATPPQSDAEIIAAELERQTGMKFRTAPPKTRPSPVGEAPKRAAAPRDCAEAAEKTAIVCAGALQAAAAGSSTGPADLVILGVGGAACGLEYLDYYRCITGQR